MISPIPPGPRCISSGYFSRPQAARAVLWLNPEPRSYWDTGDSAMSHYAKHCTSVHEVRTLRQLEEFIENLTLPSTKTFQNV